MPDAKRWVQLPHLTKLMVTENQSNSNKSTNQMQLFHNFITLKVYVSRNMFRAPPRPSSGAYNCINRLWFHRWSVDGSSVVGGGLAGWHNQSQTTTNNAVTTNAPTVKPEAVNAVVSCWWWERRRPKHVERHTNLEVINLWNSCIWLVDLLELYDDAWTCQRQKNPIVNIAADRMGTAATHLQSIIMSSLVYP